MPDLKQQGNRHLAAREYSAAEATFRLLTRERPQEKDGYVGLAKTLERLAKHEEIVDLLEPTAERLNSAQVFRLLGDAYRVLALRGRPELIDRAIDSYRRSLALKRDPVSLFYSGELLFERGDFEEALRCYLQSWELDPRSRPAHDAARVCLEKLDRNHEIAALSQRWQDLH